jgi:hypothetical protein
MPWRREKINSSRAFTETNLLTEALIRAINNFTSSHGIPGLNEESLKKLISVTDA